MRELDEIFRQEEPLTEEQNSYRFAQDPVTDAYISIQADSGLPQAQPQRVQRKKPLRKRVPLGLRFLLQLVSFGVFLALMLSLLCLTLVIDGRSLTSTGGIKTLISSVMSVQAQPQRMPVLPAAKGRFQYVLRDVVTPGSPGIQPTADMTDMASLTDWVADMAQQLLGEDANVSRENVEKFLEQSTVTDYLADKMGGYISDALNGTEDTQITSQELTALIRENAPLIRENFGVALDDAQLQQIQTNVDAVLAESDINNAIHQQVREAINDPDLKIGAYSLQEILDMVNKAISDESLLLLIFISGILVLVLCLLNFYNIPAGISWIGWAGILAGLILSLPVFFLQTQQPLLQQLLGSAGAGLVPLIASLAAVLAPIHYGLLGTGLALVLITTVWRVTRSVIYYNQLKAA